MTSAFYGLIRNSHASVHAMDGVLKNRVHLAIITGGIAIERLVVLNAEAIFVILSFCGVVIQNICLK
jgi:butyrate kinase